MKKTFLSFLCIGSTCMVMAQTSPSTNPPATRSTTTQPAPTTNPNSTLNNNTNTTKTPNTLNNTTSPNGTLNNSSNGTLNNTTNPTTTQPNGTVNGHNTLMDEKRNYPGNSNMNNTPANSTLNGNTTTPNGTLNNSTNNSNMNNSNLNNQNLNNSNLNNSNLNNQNLNNSNLNNSSLNNTTDPNMNRSLGSTSTNAAYSVSVPTSIQSTFTTAYPAAGSSVTWQQSGDWYRARYMENGKLMEASYREDGKSFTRAASPVMRTYVPEETVNRVMQQYGMNVYAIAAAKGNDGQNVYNVTVIENGQSRTEWMNADGSPVTTPYRTEMKEQQQGNSNMSSPNGQTTTPATGTTEHQEAAPAPATNNNTPAKTNGDNLDNSAEMQQQTLEQGNAIPEVTPNNNANDSGINNGTSSDQLLRDRKDQDDAQPEE